MIDMSSIEVRRESGHLVEIEDVPPAVLAAVEDQIVEDDLDAGQVLDGGQTWTWQKS